MIQFPFTAVAGQATFKLALILAAINPSIGGVLISGPRGCAKSTLARGLADILPPLSSNQVHSFVTLPLGASEEMLVGTLDLQQVLNDKEVAFRPGLLAKAHGGVLYVDEVNLLADSHVDLLLDVAASGINTVERDGISHSHKAEFILLGTMNPDEGELRAQLQDRFGLALELTSQYSIEERIEIVSRRETFDLNPSAFCEAYAEQQTELVHSIQQARSQLSNIACANEIRIDIATRCHAANVDGLRADIVWYRAALAHAAWCGNDEITLADVDAVEDLVLSHRRNTDNSNSNNGKSNPPQNGGSSNPYSRPDNAPLEKPGSGQWGSMAPQTQTTQDVTAPKLVLKAQGSDQSKSVNVIPGKKPGLSLGGQTLDNKVSNKPDWFSTLVNNLGQWPPQKIRYGKSRRGQAMLHLILLDTSASTLSGQLFAQAKGLILQIAQGAYVKREQLAIMGFGNDQVEDILPRVRAPKQIRQQLDLITAGGGTPIRDALLKAQSYLNKLKQQMPELSVCTYLITDGRSRQSVTDVQLAGETLVMDIEHSPVKRGRAPAIAQELGATYLDMSGYFNQLSDSSLEA